MPLGEQRGGGELMLRHLVQYGHASDVSWIVVFLEDGPLVSELRGFGCVVVVVKSGRLRQPHRTAAAVLKIARVARRERVTLILGWMAKGQLYGGLAALLARLPAIWYQLGTAQRGDWLGRIATLIPARGVITLSEAGATAQYGIRPRRPQRMVYPGAELERFDADRLPTPEEQRTRLGLPSDGPLIGIVCRLQRWKGVHVLIDAMVILHRAYPRARCVVVGGAHELEANYSSEVALQVSKLGLDEHVTFVGLQQNVPAWMQAMDIVVHASDREPFGIVVIEAMALGKPIIAGAEGGPREIVTHGVNGLLVPYGDAPALARAVQRYLDDPCLAAGVGVAARRRAAEFSAPRYAANVISALRALAS